MIPLFTTEQIRNADHYAINRLGIPGIVLMENASLSIFHAILNSFPEIEDYKFPVGIICGKGNNGGDGFAVARHFINSGFETNIVSLGKESELKGDALTNFKIIKKLSSGDSETKLIFYKNSSSLVCLNNCGIIIDAMLGTGASGVLKEPYVSIISRLNSLDTIKIAIDIPTGLDLSSGSGEIIFDADLTVTLAELKSGLFYEKGYTHCGEIVKGSIGCGTDYFDSLNVTDYLIEPEDVLEGLPERKMNAHKYSAGKVLVVAGSSRLPGASFFTANSVLKAGAGACLLAFPKSMKILAQKKLESAIVYSYDDGKDGFLKSDNVNELNDKIKWADAVAVGPGLDRNPATIEAVVEILDKYPNKKFVVDADAVFALGKRRYKKLKLKNCVLTPHHGEFAEMLGIDISKLKSNLLKIGKKFAVETGSFLVLKGAPTIIFNPSGEAFINTAGNSGMAKFGTGDVLTGIIAGFMAQQTNVERAVVSAVYLHSLAADIMEEKKTEYGYTAEDIQENISTAIIFLRNSIV